MYFLNGDRYYIHAEKRCGTLSEQLQNCLEQVSQINSEKKIFKLNFFVDASPRSNYLDFQEHIERKVAAHFHDPVLHSVIAQPPLTCKIIVEACFYDPKEWQVEFIAAGNNGAAKFSKSSTEVLLGSVQSAKFSASKLNSEHAFEQLISLFNTARFPLSSIVRQWNYIENILDFDGSEQRYQAFNDVRSGVYGTTFAQNGYPAATGIGMNQGGVIVEFVAVKSTECISRPIDNPEQIAAHHYSKEVLLGEDCSLKTTPKFERARYLELFGKKQIFISGTASIRGEKTVGIGDASEQTETTITNIRKLYSPEILTFIGQNDTVPKYNHARVYIKNRSDFASIKKTFKKHFGKLPVVYIIADICRNDLLVEIEGKVVLE